MIIKIGPIDYEFSYSKSDQDDMGCISYRKATITVDSTDMPPQVQKRVLCHEIAHAMLLSIAVGDNDEAAAEALGLQLLMFIQNNQELFKLLAKDDNEVKIDV